jgi:osmotically inducible protein OsmC
MILKRISSATWHGSGKDGKGTLTTGSKLIENAQYSFASRFEEGKGINPEELIGAAHAGCYSMALSFFLAADGIKSDKIDTQATVTIESVPAGFEITAVHLHVTGRVPGIGENRFREYAEIAKSGCAVSKLIKARISLEVTYIPN